MSEQKFICGMGFTNADVNFYNPIRIIHDNENDKDYYLFADLCKIMNEQQTEIDDLKEENGQLKQKVDFYKYFQKDARELEKENEKLRKQILNYEKLLSNSYVGEEERLDGFFGKYEIWEDELQEYKNKNEMIE